MKSRECKRKVKISAEDIKNTPTGCGFFDKLKEYRTLILIMLIVSILFVYFGQQKKGLFLDEIYSYGLSNSHYSPFLTTPEDSFIDTVVTQRDLLDYVSVNEGERFDYKSVYYNQTRDVHPPLYYWLLHTVCSFFPGEFTIWTGLVLNLIIYLLTLIILYKVADKLCKDKVCSVIAVILYGISSVGLSTVMLIRMYTLLTLLTLLLVYFILALFESGKKRYYPAVAATVFAGLFTQYYFVFYAFLLCLAFDIYLLTKKKFRKFFAFSAAALSGVVITYLLYPVCIEHLFADKVVSGGTAIENLWNFSAYKERVKFFINDIAKGSGPARSVIVVSAVTLCWNFKELKKASKGEKIHTKAAVVIVPAFFALVIAAVVSPYVIIRYVYNIVPMASVFAAYLIYLVKKVIPFGEKEYRIIIVSLVILSCIATTAETSKPAWLFEEYKWYNEAIERNKEKACIYVTHDDHGAVTSDLKHLMEFENFLVVKNQYSEHIEEYVKNHGDNSGVVVYIARGNGRDRPDYDIDEVLRKLAYRLGCSGYETLFSDKDFSQTFLLKP